MEMGLLLFWGVYFSCGINKTIFFQLPQLILMCYIIRHECDVKIHYGHADSQIKCTNGDFCSPSVLGKAYWASLIGLGTKKPSVRTAF